MTKPGAVTSVQLAVLCKPPSAVRNPLTPPPHTGNPLAPGFISEPCYNLLYLELAACRLTALPAGLARFVPNVRVLNLNYNFLADTRALEGLCRLRKLTVIGSRITATRQLVRVLRGMRDIEMLDFRYVPFGVPCSFFIVRCSMVRCAWFGLHCTWAHAAAGGVM